MAKKLKIKSGDNVKVVAGNNKGKSGLVKEVFTDTNRVLIEGVNMITKHVKPSATNPNGGIEKIEAPLHISNVAFVDAKSNTTTKIGRKLNKEGKLQRYSKSSGEFI